MSDETLTMDSVIDEEVIEACRKAGACAVALMWVKAKPRTYRQLRDHSLNWCWWLARNYPSPKVLALLSKDSNVNVRWVVARNAGTPAAVLELLSKDSDVYVRRVAKARIGGVK